LQKLDFKGNMFVILDADQRLESDALSKGFAYHEDYGIHATLPQTAYQYKELATPRALRAFKWMHRQVKASRALDGPSAGIKKLYPFQRAGVQYIIDNKYCLLADDMGVGKTIQVLAALKKIAAPTVLIVCPSHLKQHWADEIKLWLGADATIIHTGKDKVPKLGIIIVGYQMMKNIHIKKQLHRLMPFAVVVLDEIHYLKNRKSARMRCTLGHWKKEIGVIEGAERIILVSGTPLTNRPVELWTMVLRIFQKRWPHCYMDHVSFTTRFCGGFQLRGVWQDNGATNLVELNHLLRQRIMIRREKETVLPQLPDKIYTLFEVKPDKEAKKALFEEKEYHENAIRALGKGKLPPLDKMAQLRRILGTSKAKFAATWIEDALEDGVDKFVVFAHHRDAIAILQEKLADYNPVVIHGDVPIKHRADLVHAFQTDPDVRVFIGSITAASEGITLTAASHVAMVEIDWTPGRNEQAIDRCHRIGQDNAVNAYFFIYEDSLDAHVLKRSLQKGTNIKKVLK